MLLTSFALVGFRFVGLRKCLDARLTLVIGSSIYSFTTMLVTFLVGLALGGFLYARVLGEREARLSTVRLGRALGRTRRRWQPSLYSQSCR